MRASPGAAGALLAAAAVAAGAFGAHALRGRLDPDALELWQTAARYAMYGGLGLLATELSQGAPRRWAAGLLGLGSVIFAGTVGALALGGPRWLGAVTPLGGLALIAGFVVLAAGFRRAGAAAS